MDRAAKALITGSMLSYAASLAVPAFYIARDASEWIGLAALISGFFGLFVGFLCWAANPVLVVVWIFAIWGRNRVGVLLGAIIAAVLMLEFLRHDWVYADEGGGKASITGLGVGYALWVLSAVLMIAHAVRPLPQAPLTTYDEADDSGPEK
jgi:hypothetical protein